MLDASCLCFKYRLTFLRKDLLLNTCVDTYLTFVFFFFHGFLLRQTYTYTGLQTKVRRSPLFMSAFFSRGFSQEQEPSMNPTLPLSLSFITLY